jgi:hypothetical protein
MGVQQGLHASLQRLIADTNGGEECGALGLWPGQRLVEDFFGVHGSPLST